MTAPTQARKIDKEYGKIKHILGYPGFPNWLIKVNQLGVLGSWESWVLGGPGLGVYIGVGKGWGKIEMRGGEEV